MNTKNLIQNTIHSHAHAGGFIRELFQPLLNAFSHGADKHDWLELKNEDLNFFENEDQM